MWFKKKIIIKNCKLLFVYILWQSMVPLDLILSVFNYYELAFKLIIWYNVLVVFAHVFTMYLYLKKYLHVITSVITFIIITLLTHPLHLNPPLNLPIPPNLSLTLPVSHLNRSKSVLQYDMNTISTLHIFFDVSTWKATWYKVGLKVFLFPNQSRIYMKCNIFEFLSQITIFSLNI